MAFVEMVIDSIRRADLRNEWLVFLKDKSGQYSLPIYVDSLYADALKEALRDMKLSDVLVNDPTWAEVNRILSEAESASLVIDRFENGVFHAGFVVEWHGKSHTIKCPCGKALTLAVKTRTPIMADESILHSAGIGVTA